MTERKADYMEVAEKLYRKVNPKSKMDVPSSVYVTTEKWHKEWLSDKTTKLEFFDWCVITKQPK